MENGNTNDNHSHLDSQQASAEAGQGGGEPFSQSIDIDNSPSNFLDPVSNSDEKPIKKFGRPPGSRNKATELAPFHRKVRPVEDDAFLEEVFTAVYQFGVQTEGHIIAALRIPRYQWRNLVNRPNSKIRDTIQDGIEAYETKIKQQYAEVLDAGGKAAMVFLSEENKRINRKYGEADILLHAQPSTYDKMDTDDLEKLALEHVNK